LIMSEQERMSIFNMPSYKINVTSGDRSEDFAYLEHLNEFDFDQLAESYFECNWLDFWEAADFNCEAFIKLKYRGQVLGLIRFALYPYPVGNGLPEVVEILNIESVREKIRISSPVGLWLIWYAAKISMEFDCTTDATGSAVTIISLEPAIDYYLNKVRMEGQGWTTISPYEDGYAFRFSKEQASEFCDRIEDSYGRALRTD
jgi:hypothetical protein